MQGMVGKPPGGFQWRMLQLAGLGRSMLALRSTKIRRLKPALLAGFAAWMQIRLRLRLSGDARMALEFQPLRPVGWFVHRVARFRADSEFEVSACPFARPRQNCPRKSTSRILRTSRRR